MEMELLYSRALEMNGSMEYSDEDGEPSIWKQKYERAMKELEYTKKRLQQQHEDDEYDSDDDNSDHESYVLGCYLDEVARRK